LINKELLDLIVKPSILSNLAGKPPKSHYAQTYGPGLSNTFMLYFWARSKNNGKFLFYVA
jgi:hypothetical protein